MDEIVEGNEMPYAIRHKKNGEFEVYNSETMQVKGIHKTRQKAENQMRLLYSLEDKKKKKK